MYFLSLFVYMYVFYWYVCVCFVQRDVSCILCVCVCFVQRDVSCILCVCVCFIQRDVFCILCVCVCFIQRDVFCILCVCVCFVQRDVFCILRVCVCFVQRDVYLEEEWIVNGCNYSKTLEAWLALMDRQMDKVKKIFTQTYGQEADKQIFNWRLFFIFCSEVFGYNGGNEWHVAQYRFKKQFNSSL